MGEWGNGEWEWKEPWRLGGQYEEVEVLSVTNNPQDDFTINKEVTRLRDDNGRRVR